MKTVMVLIVYIDLAVLVLALVNGLLLWLPGKILRVQTKWYRLLAGTVLGILYHFTCFFCNCRNVPLTILMSFLQVVAAYRTMWLLLTVCHLVCACVLAGLLQMFGAKGLLALAVFTAGVFFSVAIAKRIYGGMQIGKLKRKVCISVANKTLSLNGYIDSGNALPIAVINARFAEYLIGKESVADMLAHRKSKISYVQMPCRTVSGDSIIPVFKPDLLTIDGIKSDLAVGISFVTMPEDMLLPQKQMREEL